MTTTTPAALQLAQSIADLLQQAREAGQFVSVGVESARYVTIALASARTGYSPKAFEMKIARGDWLEGYEYVRAPDGRVLIDMQGYEKWAAGMRGPLTASARTR